MVQLVVPIWLLILTKKFIARYNEEAGSTCAKMAKTSNDELIIAVCMQMMNRIHTMVAHNSELVFIDSTGIHMHVDC